MDTILGIVIIVIVSYILYSLIDDSWPYDDSED